MTIACHNRAQIPYYLLSSEVAVGAVVTLAGAYFLFASYQILPAGVNAISQLGLFGKIAGYGALGSGLFTMVWSRMKGRPKEHAPIPTIENPWQLPHDVTREVFSYLDTKDLVNISLVCKKWHELSSDDRLWNPKITRDFPVLNFVREGTSFNKEINESKDLYIYMSEEHFKHVLNEQIFNHGHYVIQSSLLRDIHGSLYLITHALNGTVKVWNLEEEKLVLTIDYKVALNPDEKTRYALNNYRMSYISEKGFSIWDEATKKDVLYVTWPDENSDLNAIFSRNRPENLRDYYVSHNFLRFFSTENDYHGGLRIIDQTGNIKNFKNSNDVQIWSYFLMGKTLFTGDGRGYVRFWNFETKKCFKEVRCGRQGITRINFRHNRLICSSKNGNIYVMAFDPGYLTL